MSESLCPMPSLSFDGRISIKFGKLVLALGTPLFYMRTV